MATTSQDDITVTTTWTDVAAVNTALAAASAVFQNICPAHTTIQIAGATASATAPDGTGLRLKPGESVLINSGTVWVRAEKTASNVKLAVSLV